MTLINPWTSQISLCFSSAKYCVWYSKTEKRLNIEGHKFFKLSIIWVKTKAPIYKKLSIFKFFKVLDKARDDAFLQYKLYFLYNQT